MFLPMTIKEARRLGWDNFDVILVTGDAYIDSPFDGTAVIGKALHSRGYRVGIISQPDINSYFDITLLGEPLLFWGVSGGCVDSMVANYTSLKKKKRNDDTTPGGINNKRPDRAVIRYVNLIKQNFKNKKPIIIGGIEASLRRIAHYDYWSDSVRGSILADSKADLLVYGEGERTILEIADSIKNGSECRNIRGVCYLSQTLPNAYLELPSFEQVAVNKEAFLSMFDLFYKNNDPRNAKGIYQKHGNRYLVQNPPNYYLSGTELDEIHDLEFEYDAHPECLKHGKIKSLETIKFSLISHRGCYGECNFCAISVHQGRTIRSRSKESIIKEAQKYTSIRDFKGNIFDVGGPTANMYRNVCAVQQKAGSCKNKRCSTPERCEKMNIEHNSQIELLRELRKIPGIKNIFIGSGLRYDLIVEDKQFGDNYFHDIVKYHTGGQLKIAPEHIADNVVDLMGKPKNKHLLKFVEKFKSLTAQIGKKQFLTYYFIAAHPGCSEFEMEILRKFLDKQLKFKPEQIQVFNPTPSTYSAAMYWTGLNPKTRKKIFVEKELKRKDLQKSLISGKY
ncbi:MAG: FeS oxidoreductase [Ignavibacteria bacterium]|nr:FeS oxidoreductase [Ignavibacteria bacterium]